MHVDHYEYTGTDGGGSPLLLIHGWGMHSGMWSSVAKTLAQHFNVYAVDLPGHGYSHLPSHAGGGGAGGEGGDVDTLSLALSRARERESTQGITLDAIVDSLSTQFDGPLAVCGWSLGGQVALRWALRHPQQIERLAIVASTPCFVRLDGWRFALSVEILKEFAANLQQNYAQTLMRFLSLQMRGSEQERAVLSLLRDGLFIRGIPDLNALEAGLDILRDTDLRSALPEVRQPTLVLAGERDTLIPHQAAQYLASQIPAGRLAMIKGAAHAPFLSHPDEFVKLLREFLESKGN